MKLIVAAQFQSQSPGAMHAGSLLNAFLSMFYLFIFSIFILEIDYIVMTGPN